MAEIVTRGNTVYFSFTFYDEDDGAADVDSATVQLEFAGRSGRTTKAITLTKTGSAWTGNWDSTYARAGWVNYHAHALSGSGTAQYAQDGRFKLTANRASFQHDVLPTDAGLSDPAPLDYS